MANGIVLHSILGICTRRIWVLESPKVRKGIVDYTTSMNKRFHGTQQKLCFSLVVNYNDIQEDRYDMLVLLIRGAAFSKSDREQHRRIRRCNPSPPYEFVPVLEMVRHIISNGAFQEWQE